MKCSAPLWCSSLFPYHPLVSADGTTTTRLINNGRDKFVQQAGLLWVKTSVTVVLPVEGATGVGPPVS
jgi:hypothetical protein